MKCLVCDQTIRINTLKQLFSPSPLLLCGRCEQHFIPKSGDVLFENNAWIRQVIEKLNQGDMVLLSLFERHLKNALHKRTRIDSNIKIIEYSDDLPYPWLEILIHQVLDTPADQKVASTETLVITVVAQKNEPNQLSLISGE